MLVLYWLLGTLVLIAAFIGNVADYEEFIELVGFSLLWPIGIIILIANLFMRCLRWSYKTGNTFKWREK